MDKIQKMLIDIAVLSKTEKIRLIQGLLENYTINQAMAAAHLNIPTVKLKKRVDNGTLSLVYEYNDYYLQNRGHYIIWKEDFEKYRDYLELRRKRNR